MKIKYLAIFFILIIQGLLGLLVAGTQNPHGTGLKIACEKCHVPDSWKVNLNKISFDHRQTGFPLIGAHQQSACTGCHKDLKFSYVGTQCADCHTDIHRGQLGIQCENCHSPFTWENREESRQAHQKTAFPLLGVHARLDCQACHLNQQRNEFANTPTDCFACHSPDYLNAAGLDHRRAGFGQECQSCHLPYSDNWKQVIYQHTSAFPLTGAHQRTDCNDCHQEQFIGISGECYACHQQDYNATSNPDHQAFGFLTTCQQCHSTDTWRRADFDHLAVSGFALEGAHLQTECVQCHVNNQVTGLPQDCFGCHQSDYNAVANPSHVQNNFSHNCLDCHNSNAWQPSTIDHNQTAFPLTGAHLSVNCSECHSGGFSGTPTDCFSCHENDFNNANDPNHVQNNFSHDCTECHSTEGWEPANFDHAQTQFPLTGAHVSVNCVECHSSGYSGTSRECVACHQDDYNSATNPNHQAAGFPTTCQDCHSTQNWSQSSFDHDGLYFPIYSGKHQGEWSTCTAECHVVPTNFSLFECITCHEHRQSKMDDEHQGVANYQYSSPACYNCHPTGEED
ncbi:MAG: hypothetical protein Kow0037_07940 [Calditrichia bacterium]